MASNFDRFLPLSPIGGRMAVGLGAGSLVVGVDTLAVARVIPHVAGPRDKCFI